MKRTPPAGIIVVSSTWIREKAELRSTTWSTQLILTRVNFAYNLALGKALWADDRLIKLHNSLTGLSLSHQPISSWQKFITTVRDL